MPVNIYQSAQLLSTLKNSASLYNVTQPTSIKNILHRKLCKRHFNTNKK